jgi:hypothetical protein
MPAKSAKSANTANTAHIAHIAHTANTANTANVRYCCWIKGQPTMRGCLTATGKFPIPRMTCNGPWRRRCMNILRSGDRLCYRWWSDTLEPYRWSPVPFIQGYRSDRTTPPSLSMNRSRVVPRMRTTIYHPVQCQVITPSAEAED